MWTVFLKVIFATSTWSSKKPLPPLPSKECSKSFSESGSLKIHLTLLSPGALSFVKFGFASGSIFECKIVRTWGTRHFKTERERIFKII